MIRSTRKYKDSLFSHYFSDEGRLIEAYNAIAGKNYPLTTDIKFQKLESVLAKEQINDIAFMLEDRLIVFLEHQSSFSYGMPLRCLL